MHLLGTVLLFAHIRYFYTGILEHLLYVLLLPLVTFDLCDLDEFSLHDPELPVAFDLELRSDFGDPWLEPDAGR